jgi:hypothetical protein
MKISMVLKSLNIIFTWFFLSVLLTSCLPEQTKDPNVCSPGYLFDVVSRKCSVDPSSVITDQPPVATLKMVTINEDSGANSVILTYSDINGNLASSCSIPTYSLGLDLTPPSACTCVAGTCTTSITPNSNFSGLTDFSYTVTDVHGTSFAQIVIVNVVGSDDPPVNDTASVTPLTMPEDTETVFTLPYTDVDNNLEATYCELSSLTNLQIAPTYSCGCTSGVCTVRLVGLSNYFGAASFDYFVTNNGFSSTPTTVNVTITAVNDAPTPYGAETFNTTEDTLVAFAVQAATDPEGDGITYNVATNPTNGTLTNCMGVVNGQNCTYTPDPDFFGTDSFTYTVTDGTDTSSAVTVTITVTGVNDNPIFNPAPIPNQVGTEDTTISILFTGDEGGPVTGSYEDSQTLQIKVESANTTILPQSSSNIVIKYDGTDIGYDGTNYVSLGDGANDASAKNITLELIPVADESTAVPFNVTITLLDSEGGTTTNVFTVEYTDVDDAPRFTTTLADMQMNEGGSVLSSSIGLDEGGGTGEDSQQMRVQVTSSNTTLLPSDTAHIKLYYDSDDDGYPDTGEEITAVGGIYSLNDPVGDTDIRVLLEFIPVGGLSGETTITVGLDDDLVGTVDETTTTFKLTVHPISADHGGWKNIQAIGQKVDLLNKIRNDITCTYSTNKCDSGQSCTGSSVNPSGTVSADEANTIYYDSGKDVCYYSTASGNSSWEFLTTHCNITPSATETSCSALGASCIGTASPSGTYTPVAKGSYFYDATNDKCYRSTGTSANTDWEEQYGNKVVLEWNDFTMVGTGQDSDAQISGWNIYRRKLGEAYDYTSPLNSTTLASTVRTYSDTTAVPNQVYFYLVRPIDNKRSLATATEQIFSEVRIISPPSNMVFIHRWMVNNEVCKKMHLDVEPDDNTLPWGIDSSQNYICEYTGPGDKLIGASYYYDIGKDYLVDLNEAGCPYSSSVTAPECGIDGCVGILDPTTAAIVPGGDGLYYYNRASGVCSISFGGNWEDLYNYKVNTLEANYPTALADSSQSPFLPPVVNLAQQMAYDLCSDRTQIAANAITGVVNAVNYKLPSRKEMIAYSAWTEDLSEFNISVAETGLSLNSSSKCNSSSASGLTSAYTMAAIPSSTNLFSLPGTDDSNIRSIYTGSESYGTNYLTKECISRYGVQDFVGNVSEWTSDEMVCSGYTCTGVTQTNDAGFGVAKIDTTNDDFATASADVFGTYGLNDLTGPCGNSCTSFLEEWKFEAELYSAGRFNLPLALPLKTDFPYTYSNSDASQFMLEIGPTSGITTGSTGQLHGDSFNPNMDDVVNATNGLGGVVGGGSYNLGEKAGRYSFELIPSSNITGTQASVVIGTAPAGQVTVTADSVGTGGNNIVITIYDDASTAFTSISTVGNYVTIYMDTSGVIPADTLRDAINNDPVTAGLVTAVTTTAANMAGGADGSHYLTGGTESRNSYREDIGFRCVIPIESTDYDITDPYHNYSY